jgi:hypothetical protein
MEKVRNASTGQMENPDKVMSVTFDKKSCTRRSTRITRNAVLIPGSFLSLVFIILLCLPSVSQGQVSQAPQSPGTISGTIVDQSGSAVTGATVTLTRGDQSASQQAITGDQGQFSFTNVAPGPYQLTITATNFTTQTSSGVLRAGEASVVPQITLPLATAVTEVHVGLTKVQMAEVQIQNEEKQRVLGFIPNFYVSYVPNAEPLTSKLKFELALKASVDPVTFAVTAAGAGIEQAGDYFNGYGQGAEGYGRRYGALYGDYVISTFIGGAILPSILKQDPRYFYKGTGSPESRLLYAIGNEFICKGDNGRWQPNYSAIGGDLAAGGISNLYYPDQDRGTALAFENGLINIGAGAAVNILEEFVMKKLTRNIPNSDPNKP